MSTKSGPCLPWCFQYYRSYYIFFGFFIAFTLFFISGFFYKYQKNLKKTSLKNTLFKNKFQKIIFVGFNKTASSSIHKLFLENNYKSKHTVHNFEKEIQKYDVLSDPGNLNDIEHVINYKNIYRKYPQSIFILNTRSLHDWLISRSKHYYRRGVFKSQSFGYPISTKIIIDWILKRNQYYYKLLNFFKNKKNKLIILDIDDQNWIPFLSYHLSLKKINVYENKTLELGDKYLGVHHTFSIPKQYNNKILQSIFKAYKKLNIKDPSSKLFNTSIINKNIHHYPFKNNIQ